MPADQIVSLLISVLFSVATLVIITFNLVVDLLYAVIDPRIRLS